MRSRYFCTVKATVLSATLSIGASVLCTPARAGATVMVRRSIDEMASVSDLVTVATVRRATALWVNNRIYTDIEAQIETVVRGTARVGSSVVIRTPGGIVGETGQHLAGAPSLRPGERYLLFLRHSRSGLFETVGLSQGALPVRNLSQPTASTRPWVFPPTTAGLELVDPAGPRPAATTIVPPQGMPLEALVQALRSR